MTKERIEIIRETVLPFVKEKLIEINYEGLGKYDAEEFEKDFNEILNLAINELEKESCDIEVLSLEEAAVVLAQGTIHSTYCWHNTLKPFKNLGLSVCKIKEVKDYNPKLIEKQPCEDCVSREAVVDFLKNHSKDFEDKRSRMAFRAASSLVENPNNIPPVTPLKKWIPVSKRLPKPFEYVNCTCHSLIDNRNDWVVETVYIPQPQNSHYSDWGNIPMLNSRECEVIAWMHRDIPEPYKEESEE